jgi:hypothetical protein
MSKHVAERAVMDVIAVGVVVVTPASLANPYVLDEARMFTDRDALVLVLVLVGENGRRLAATSGEALAFCSRICNN